MGLVREGRAPSMAEAAERALMSQATAYRYFSTADELWEEASMELAIAYEAGDDFSQTLNEQAGDDVAARLQLTIRRLGWRMLDEETPFRVMARNGLERWFEQRSVPESDREPVRAGRRRDYNAEIVRPLRSEFSQAELTMLESALALVWGPEAVITLRDVCLLDVDGSKATMETAARWILQGALADHRQRPT